MYCNMYVATCQQGPSEVIIVSRWGSCDVRSKVLSTLVQPPSDHSGVYVSIGTLTRRP